MIDYQVTVEDLPRIQSVLKELSEVRESRKEVKKGLSEAGKLLKKRGKERLRARLIMPRKDRTGNLLKSFRHKVKRKNQGVLAGFMMGKGGGSHAHLIDEGTKSRKTKKGYNRGWVKPNYFWTDTRKSDAPKAQQIIVDHINEAIQAIKNRAR